MFGSYIAKRIRYAGERLFIVVGSSHATAHVDITSLNATVWISKDN